MLVRALDEETVQTQDRVMMGMASLVGLEKGAKPSSPTPLLVNS